MAVRETGIPRDGNRKLTKTILSEREGGKMGRQGATREHPRTGLDD